MNGTEFLILNLDEVRRRSIKIWEGLPHDKLRWKTDAEASCVESVHHVLKGEWAYMQMLRAGKSVDPNDSPFYLRELADVSDELYVAEPYSEEFLELVKSYSPEELSSRKIDRSDVGYMRAYGDFILRIGYHESVHALQILGYLRAMKAPRPNIWD